VRDCNHLYRSQRALHERDCEPDGFRWIEVNDRDRSVFAWLRTGGPGAPPLIALFNFTPVPRDGYQIGLPLPGRWREVLNTDAALYGGSDRGNAGGVDARPGESHGYPNCARVALPPLGAIWLVHEAEA
jgi:1,4-alpha-glucan branching enzyme